MKEEEDSGCIMLDQDLRNHHHDTKRKELPRANDTHNQQEHIKALELPECRMITTQINFESRNDRSGFAGHGQSSKEKQPVQPRKRGHELCDGRVLMIGGTRPILDGNGQAGTQTEFHNPRTNTWIKGPALYPYRRFINSCLLTNGNIFVVGGEGLDGRPLACVHMYDPFTNTWTTLPPLKFPRRHALLIPQPHSVLVLSSHAIDDVYNGSDRETQRKIVPEIFYLRSNTWTRTKQYEIQMFGENEAKACFQPTPHRTGCVLKDGRVMVLSLVTGRVKFLQPHNLSWSNGATMPMKCTDPAQTPVAAQMHRLKNGNVMVVMDNDTQVYDPNCHRWSRVSPDSKNLNKKGGFKIHVLPNGFCYVEQPASGTSDASQFSTESVESLSSAVESSPTPIVSDTAGYVPEAVVHSTLTRVQSAPQLVGNVDGKEKQSRLESWCAQAAEVSTGMTQQSVNNVEQLQQKMAEELAEAKKLQQQQLKALLEAHEEETLRLRIKYQTLIQQTTTEAKTLSESHA